MSRSVFRFTAFSAVFAATVSAVFAAPFTSSSIVVSRLGDGSAALSGSTAAVFLDEFTTAGSLVQSVAMPTVVSGSNARFTLGGTATSSGHLTLSTDKKFLTLFGVDTDVGTASPTSTSGINRTVAVVSGAGTIDTTTKFLAAGSTPRSAVSTNGTDIWTSADTGSGTTGGIRYLILGSSTNGTLVGNTVTNMRAAGIFGGQLYAVTQSGANRAFAMGTGLPTTLSAMTALTGIVSTAVSPNDFFFSDANTLYFADDGSTAANNGFQKWTFDGTSWVKQWTVAAGGASNLVRTMTGVVTSGGVQLYGITGETSANRLISLLDTGVGAPMPSLLSTAGTNTVFRGVDFAPIPEPNAILIGIALAGAGVWIRRRK